MLGTGLGSQGSEFSRLPRRVLICPDSFKGSLTAKAAAESISRGICQVLPGAEVELVPLADGGEGTLEILLLALGGEKRGLWVTGPLGDPVWAEYGVAGEQALLEVAQVAGLTLLPPERRDPTRTTTYGLGELARLVRIEPPKQRIWQGKRVRGLCDVQNPLTGSLGAAAVFAPQKGATPAQVQQLEQALQHWARVVERDLGLAVERIPGAGAAGGLGAGLVAFLGATLESGIRLLAQQLALPERVRRCDLVVTGEGRLDEQSSMGKVVGAVLEEAIAAQKPLLILCGQATPTARANLAARPLPIGVAALCDWIPDVAEAQRQAAYHLEQMAAWELKKFLSRDPAVT